MKICVVGGAGYVGLITGLGFAETGHSVTNVDVDESRIRALQSGESPILEFGIEETLKRNLGEGRISFSTSYAEAVSSSEIIFIAVGTPSREDGLPDISQVINVAEELRRSMDSYKVIVIKSTVPVGTVELVKNILSQEHQEGDDFDIVSNPEFLREGNGLQDFFYPDRIVIGTESPRARRIMHDLYEPIVQRKICWKEGAGKPQILDPIPVVDTDPASAQMIKYASNAFLAARISFINEIAGLCGKVGADVKEVGRGMGHDPRIGHAYLDAGLGFGGPCLEKDLRALMKLAEGNGYEPQLLRAVLERNDKQVGEAVAKLKALVGQLLYKKTVAVFGLAFKQGTNDVRNSSALKVIDRLEQEGAIVRAHDPVAIAEAQAVMPQVAYFEDAYQTVQGADALLILTEWSQFRDLDFQKIKKLMAFPNIVDARNLLDPQAVRSLGFNYSAVGRV